MPVIAGLTPLQTRAANTIMARAFFPRAHEWLYPKLAGTTISTSKVEPFSIVGSVPALSRYTGALRSRNVASYSMNVPNLLFKNLMQVQQSQYEFDQTGTVVQFSQGLGMRLAQFPDQLWASRVLRGSDPVYATTMFENQSYNLTFDGQPFFSENHEVLPDGGTQSNILQGHLPLTQALLNAQTWATSAQQMQQDLNVVINALKTVKDNDGMPIFATIDTKKSIVAVVPPCLEATASLAFRTDPSTTVISQTTNIAPMFLNAVMTSGYLAGFLDVDPATGEEGSTVTPVNETDWYVFIIDDFVKPFYMQLFRPQRASERFPLGQAAVDPVDRIVASGKGISVAQATLFASTRIDTTFNKIGANSDAYTIQNEAFWMSARYRGNMVYGPWFTGWRIIPVNGATGSSSSSSN